QHTKQYSPTQQKKYPHNMQNNPIIPTNPIPHHNLKKHIQNFNFFLQYPNFKHFKHYKNPHISYNPNLPSYSP
ncbi:Csa1 family protein, partial [Staphylococcus aureus]|uniref:Csa1 family protein n=1 Tax=Staphylococcus aureus TaxID=1280 RepID=UPI0011A13722